MAHYNVQQHSRPPSPMAGSSKAHGVLPLSELRFLLKQNQATFDQLIEVVTLLREQLEGEEAKLFACLAEEQKLRKAIAAHKQQPN